MAEVTIALLQITPGTTLEENLQIGLQHCIKAKELGADIALFPEMWSNGYRLQGRPVSQWKAEAISRGSSFLQTFGQLAQKLNMAIGITFLEVCGDAPRNSMVLFDRFGRDKFCYAKVHTCAFDVERNLTPGDAFYVTELDTAQGPLQVGAMICFDREFPESARILMLQGAELILVPNACEMELNRLSQLRGRAYENMLAIATCNYPETVPGCNGHSTLFDGVAYHPDLPESRDTCLLQADSSQGIFLAKLDLDLLRRYRQTEVHGNAYRRPEIYRPLLNTEVHPPFLRKDWKL